MPNIISLEKSFLYDFKRKRSGTKPPGITNPGREGGAVRELRQAGLCKRPAHGFKLLVRKLNAFFFGKPQEFFLALAGFDIEFLSKGSM